MFNRCSTHMYLKITDLQSMIMLKTSVVNTLIYNKLFSKCHVGLYTWDVPLYLQQFFLSEKDATNSRIYYISVQSHQKQLCLYKITKCLVTVCLTLESWSSFEVKGTIEISLASDQYFKSWIVLVHFWFNCDCSFVYSMK